MTRATARWLRAGYAQVDLGGDQRAFVASPEKAFLDLVHLQPGGDDPDWIAGLRLNLGVLRPDGIEAVSVAAGSPTLVRAAGISSGDREDVACFDGGAGQEPGPTTR